MFSFDGFSYDRINEYHNQRREEFLRLAADPCMKIANIGDRVLVSGGLCGMGFHWDRHEGVVLDVADTAYKLEFPEYMRGTFKDKPHCGWFHRLAVTDVLTPKS